MTIDWILVLATFGIGIVVGLTGMGGGALMTPVLVIFFGIPPLTAVSSDLVAAAVMKPVGSIVHLRRGTVNLSLVKWLAIGSVPAAFCGVLITRAMGDSEAVQHGIQIALGVALLVAAGGLSVRAYVRLAERARRRDGSADKLPQDRPEVAVRVLPTVAVGIVGGVIVGMTSVGSGSLIIIALMALYPALKASQLVGTDLVQAVPLVAAAALGHVLFGDFQLSLTLSLLIGCVPGAWLGARISSRAPGGFVRRALAFVLLASALKLLGLPNGATVVTLLVVLLAAPLVWFALRRHHGLPGFVRLGHLRPGTTDSAHTDPPAGSGAVDVDVADSKTSSQRS